MQKIRPDMDLGFRIQMIRNECRMTQDSVVAELQRMGISISRGVYAKIETNRMNIKVSELLALTLIFNVTLEDIFKDCLNEIKAYKTSSRIIHK